MEEVKTELQIEIDEQTAQGIYSNLAMIAHSQTEFVFDFIFIQPQTPKAKVRTRIITTPQHAKKFLLALQENIKRYEDRFGEINVKQIFEGDKKIGFFH